MAAPRLLPSIGGLALAIVAAACAAPTPTPTPAPEPTASERVTEELLPGMQWADLEPGLAWFVRAHVASPDDKAGILDGLYALGGDEYLPPDVDKVTVRGWAMMAEIVGLSLSGEKEAAERENALAELAADAYLVDDDNLYLRWRKIEDRATGAKNALFDQLADLRERNGLPDRDPTACCTEEEWAAFSPREYALELWYKIIRIEDDDMRDGMLDWWVSDYEGTDEGDYVLRNTNQSMRMPRYLNAQLGKTAQMKAVKASVEAMERHILQETGDPAAAARYWEWFWMETKTTEAFMRKADELGLAALDYDWLDAVLTATPWPTPTPRPTATPRPTPSPWPTATPTDGSHPVAGPYACLEIRRREGAQSRAYWLCYRDWLERERARATLTPTPRPTATPRPTPTLRPTAIPTTLQHWPIQYVGGGVALLDGKPVVEGELVVRVGDWEHPTAIPVRDGVFECRRSCLLVGPPRAYIGEPVTFFLNGEMQADLTYAFPWLVLACVVEQPITLRFGNGPVPPIAAPCTDPTFYEIDEECWETTPVPGWRDSVTWTRVDCDTRLVLPATPTPTPRPTSTPRPTPPPPATPTPIPCPSTGYGAMSCVRAWPAGVPVRAAVECWIDAECGGFEYYERVAKLDASEPVLYWAAPDLARRNPVVVNQVGRALQRMAPLLGVEFRETESRSAARLVIRMEEDRECKSEQAAACGSARFAYHLNGASGPDGWEIALSEVMIRDRYTNSDSAYRMLIHEFGHALTGMGHSYRCGSLMRDWEDEGFIRGCVAAGYPRYHWEFSPMDVAVMLINSHPAVAAGTRRSDWRDFICGRDC